MKCVRCNRPLTGRRSIERGMGKECARKMNASSAKAQAQYKATTVAKALELIDDGGIVAVKGNRVFRVVASDGVGSYLTAREACTCPCGLRAKFVCCHRVAVELVA